MLFVLIVFCCLRLCLGSRFAFAGLLLNFCGFCYLVMCLLVFCGLIFVACSDYSWFDCVGCWSLLTFLCCFAGFCICECIVSMLCCLSCLGCWCLFGLLLDDVLITFVVFSVGCLCFVCLVLLWFYLLNSVVIHMFGMCGSCYLFDLLDFRFIFAFSVRCLLVGC